MSDMLKAIAPKSDQLNADDLIGGAITIKITGMTVVPDVEQPIRVFYAGGGEKPYKPCKSMGVVMVKVWGEEAKSYVGKSMTLYRDPNVKWSGMKIGGIRISHMSHIQSEMTFPLKVARGKYALYTVKPLKQSLAEPAAQKGMASYQEYFKALTPDERKELAASGEHERLKKIAADADSANTPPPLPEPPALDAGEASTLSFEEYEKLGRQAALDGLSRTDCPLNLKPEERGAWRYGFDKADEEANGGA